jgi:hypothetical protein
VSCERRLPADPVLFIQAFVRRRRLLWTYHVNMRLAGRFIRRDTILDAVETFELVEAYPDDKYLPATVLGRAGGDAFHVLFAIDVETDNVRIVTAYRPTQRSGRNDLKTRRPKKECAVRGGAQDDPDGSALQGERPRHHHPEGPPVLEL